MRDHRHEMTEEERAAGERALKELNRELLRRQASQLKVSPNRKARRKAQRDSRRKNR